MDNNPFRFPTLKGSNRKKKIVLNWNCLGSQRDTDRIYDRRPSPKNFDPVGVGNGRFASSGGSAEYRLPPAIFFDPVGVGEDFMSQLCRGWR